MKNDKLKKLSKRLKSLSKELQRIVWLIEQSTEREDKYG